MNFYQKHIGDYTRDTVGLSMLEDGAYNRLLDWYYATEHPLPADLGKIHRLARAATPREKAAVESVIAQFFVKGPDGYHNKRANEEILRQRERTALAAEAGRRSGESRRAKSERTFNGRSTDAGIPLPFRSTNQNPESRIQNPENGNDSPRAAAGSEEVEDDTFNVELATLKARQAGFEQSEIDIGVSECRRRRKNGANIQRLDAYLLTVLAGNRTKAAKGKSSTAGHSLEDRKAEIRGHLRSVK